MGLDLWGLSPLNSLLTDSFTDYAKYAFGELL